MGELKRTHLCTELSLENLEERVVVMGWVQKRRDHGGLIFIDLRDRSGLIQVVFNPDIDRESFQLANNLRSEFVVAVEGKVTRRPEGNINPDLATGEIELTGTRLIILNEAETTPFPINDNTEVSEDLRLKYRYLDLRRPQMQKNIYLRHKAMKISRDYLTEKGFWEIETPILTRSTPEGARDYLVPSRVNAGKFYALPQSPQLFKQLLMVAGMERYFQIARCFRDEDLRANRQPEFTQIDLEMSFVSKEDVMEVTEGLIRRLFQLIEVEVAEQIPVLTYQEAMARYGSDKPDTRFAMELVDLSDLLQESGFKVFADTIAQGGQVKGIKVEQGAALSRSTLDKYTDFVKIFKAKGLIWLALKKEGLKSPVARFLSEAEIEGIISRLEAQEGDLILLVADKAEVVANALGNLRLKVAREQGLIPEDKYNFLWVVDFPLLEYDEEEGRYVAKHHPFTAPLKSDLPLLDEAPDKVRADAYDLVLNGEEIAGGSIRINNSQLQEKVFKALNIQPEEAREKFGFLLEAFKYGTPPHGGIAFGFDRIIMFLTKTNSIRDVIAFPKTQKATSPLTDAPSKVAVKQLEELKIKVID